MKPDRVESRLSRESYPRKQAGKYNTTINPLENAVQLIVIAIQKQDGHCYEKRFTKIGFRKALASDDKRLVFHLPYGAFVAMREGAREPGQGRRAERTGG